MTDGPAQRYLVRPGGLMRCCVASLDEQMSVAEAAPAEGDKVSCAFCSSSMRFRDGAWEWDKINDDDL